MTDKQKIKEYFEEYINNNRDNGLNSGALISYMLHMMNYHNIEIIDVIKFLVNNIDQAKINLKRYIETNGTPTPIVIAPETKEGKALLRSIIEMKNKK